MWCRTGAPLQLCKMWPLLQISCLKKHKCYSSSTKDCIFIWMRRGENFEVFDQVLESETCLETCSALLVVIKPGFFPMTTIFSTSHLSHPHHGHYHPSPLRVRSCANLGSHCWVISQLEDWPELCEKILLTLIKPENSDVDLSSWCILTMWTIICVGVQESTTQHFGEKHLKYIVPVGAWESMTDTVLAIVWKGIVKGMEIVGSHSPPDNCEACLKGNLYHIVQRSGPAGICRHLGEIQRKMFSALEKRTSLSCWET